GNDARSSSHPAPNAPATRNNRPSATRRIHRDAPTRRPSSTIIKISATASKTDPIRSLLHGARPVRSDGRVGGTAHEDVIKARDCTEDQKHFRRKNWPFSRAASNERRDHTHGQDEREPTTGTVFMTERLRLARRR